MNLNFRRFLFKLLLPISKTFGKLHAPWSKKRVKQKQVEDLLERAEPGDVILTRTLGEMTNFTIPEYFKHAAMYVGGSRVVESVSPKTKETGIYDFLMSKDSFALMRARWLTKEERAKSAQIMLTLVGVPYDFFFQMTGKDGAKEMYCAESCQFSLAKAKPTEESVFTKRKVLGAESVLPHDFFSAVKSFDAIMRYPLLEVPTRE
jgi:hypothetical protein